MKASTPWLEGAEVATAMMVLDYPKNTPTFSAKVPDLITLNPQQAQNLDNREFVLVHLWQEFLQWK